MRHSSYTRLNAKYDYILYGSIYCRRYWHNGISIEKTSKRVNLLVRNQVISIGGCAIRHCNLHAREVNVYRNDGTHLSNSGTEIYLNNIQGALERFISSGDSRFPSNSSLIRIEHTEEDVDSSLILN